MKRSLLYLSSLVLFILSISFFFVTGCQRDLIDPGGNGNPPPGNGGNTVNDNIMVSASVRGIVVNENNLPVAGAVVTSGTNTTTTDSYGAFRFNNISLSKANGYVKVTRTGYFTGSRTFISIAGRTHNVRIKLLPKTNTGSFAGSAGGTINITGGGKLVMPANAVTDASGNAYAGTVNVAMRWIDPASNDLPNILPGDLRAVTTTNEERGLQTFGMLGVELTDNSGQPVKIATGKKAELTFPVPASLQANAPATIDLWHFDETTGRWKQEGTATRTGNNYIAQVSHFSFWNCDASFPVVNLCMTVVNAGNNSPLNNTQVRIKRPNGSYGYGRTDSSGNLCGKVPKNEALVLEIIGQCDFNEVMYSQNIGPFSGDASLGTIASTLVATNTLTITGTLVNCSNVNVTNGVAIIYTSNANSYSVPVTDGAFSLTIVRCAGEAVNFSILGVDYATLQQGMPVSGSGTSGTVNVGTVQACGTSSTQFFELMIDGNPFNFAAPPDNISCSDSLLSGNNVISVTGIKIGGNSYASFSFILNGSTGAQDLLTCRIYYWIFGLGETISSPIPTVNITTLGPPVTGFIEGNFNIQMNFDITPTPKNVVCTFRVRRP
jgi:hypothetical protein